MPIDSTPRSFDFLILKSPSGVWNTVPIIATGTVLPASQFGAPQTICSGSPCPTSTLQTDMWSESGWGLRSRIRPTTTPAGTVPADSTASTSMPAIVSLSQSVGMSQSTATYCVSQLREISI